MTGNPTYVSDDKLTKALSWTAAAVTPFTRGELQKAMKVSQQTACRIVRLLLQTGDLKQIGERPTGSPGRPHGLFLSTKSKGSRT